MRTEQILSADVLDIIFDKRNKNYGAYDLRKFYGNRLAKALVMTFSLAGAAILSFSVLKSEKADRPELPPDIDMVRIIETLPPVEIKAPQPKPEPKQTPKVASQKFVENIVITKKENEADALAKNLDLVAISSVTQEGDGKEKLIVKGPEPGTHTGTEVTVKAVDKITPMASPEIMPAYPGGIEALRKFLQRNLQNPQDLEEGQVVAVKIKFVVGYDGKLKSFEIVEDGGNAFNNEVIRVLKKMPEWVPGKSNGENVSVYYSIPVKFTAAE